MASLSPEEKVEFLVQLLATGEFTPDYDALAKIMGINTKSNAQHRLKAIVEADKRFTLQSSGGTTSVTDSGKAGNDKGTTDSAKKTGSARRGRKRTKAADLTDNDEESPSKAPKKDSIINIEDDEGAGGVDNGGSEEHIMNEDVI